MVHSDLNRTRLKIPQCLGFLDDSTEEAFDRLTRLAADVVEAPMGAVVLINEIGEPVFKSSYGFPASLTSQEEIPIPEDCPCRQVLLSEGPVVIDDLFKTSAGQGPSLAKELEVRAYAGIPLLTPEGQSIGCLGILDRQPRDWSEKEIRLIKDLAASVMTEIELRVAVREIEHERHEKTLLLESTGEGIYGIDPQGCCTFANKSAAVMLGYEPEELIRKNMHQLVHHSHRDGTPYPIEECPIVGACRTGRSVDLCNQTLWRRDGTCFSAEYSAFPMTEGGEIKGAVVTLRDITDRKAQEESLRQREEHLQAVIRTTPECVKLVAADGTLLKMNPAGLRMIEADAADQAVGQSIYGVIAPEYREKYRRFHEWICQGNKGTLEFDVVGLRGARRRMETHAVPLRYTDGTICELAITRDVTQRRQNEELLAGQKRILEMIAKGERLPAILTVLARLIEEQSDRMLCSILLLDQDQRLRHGAAPSLPDDYKQAVDGLAIGPNAGSCGTAAYRREPVCVSDIDTDPHWDEYRDLARSYGLRACWSTPIFSKSGQVLGAFALYYCERREPSPDERRLVDIATHLAGIAIERIQTENALRERARKLAEADRRKDEFLAMLAHELRNPLSPIRSGVDLLAIEGANPDTVELMREQTDHLVRLVDDLLDVSRIMRGKIELRREPTQLNSVIARALEVVAPLIDEQEHEFIQQLPLEPVWLDADPVRLSQVLANLINNAAKYTERKGRIQLGAHCEDNMVVIRVQDNGIGIAPDLLPQVFDLFTQADCSIDRSQGGLGIGLTLVRSLVEMHGGTVTAQSKGPGQGSTFTVRLPIISSPQRNQACDSSMTPMPKRRVLIVDDNHGATQLLALLLQKLGDHDISVAHNGEEALQQARQCRPDIIILDIGLPGMNGYEVAERLRQQPEFEQTLLVALTGYGQAEDRRRALEAGFDEHLVKPPPLKVLKRLFSHPKLPAAVPHD